MSSVRGLVLPLLFFCWETGVLGSSAGPSTSRTVPLVTSNNRVVPTMTQGVRTSSEGGFQTIDLTETSTQSHVSLKTQTLSTKTLSKNLIPVGTTSKVETREAQTMSPAMETNTLTKVRASNFRAVVTSPVETSVMSSSPTGTGTTTAERSAGSGPTEAIFDTLCSDDSSEETKRMVAGSWTLTQISPEAESLSSESSSSADSSVSVNTTSHILSPDAATRPKALVEYSITHIEFTRGSVMKIETVATISGTSDIEYSPTGGQAESTSETSALSTSTEVKSHIPKTTASAETLSAASTSESASPDSTPEAPLPTSLSTERETAAAQTSTHTPSGTLVAGSTSPWEETSALSAGTTRHLEVSGAGTHSTDAGSTVGTVTSSAGPRASIYSSSEAATIQISTLSETFATEGTTTGSFPTSRSPLPSVHPSAASSSQETHFTFSKATATPESPTATPTTAQTRQTIEVPAANTLWATTSGTLDSDYSPTGGQAVSTSETLALSASTEAKSHVSRTTASAETLSTASASESASPDSTPEAPLPTSLSTERETAAAQTSTHTPSGTLVAGSTSPWEETSALSAGTTHHLEVSGPGTHSTTTGSTVGTVTSSAGPRASIYSSSEAATIQISTSSETFATEGTTTGSFPTSRSPLPSVHPSTASSSQETHFTFSKATATPESSIASPTTAQTRHTTEVPAANILWATTSGTLDSDYSPTGGQAVSTSEIPALSTSTEAKSHIPKTTASAETLSAASTSESASPDSTPEAPLPTSRTTERETAAAQMPTPSGTLVAGSTSPWEETSALSAGTTRHLEVSGPGTHSTDAGSTVGKVASSAGPRASIYSSSEAATIQVSTLSETFATEGTTTGSFPTSRSPLPSVHPSTANRSQETHFTFSKATATPESPTATPTTAQTRQTTEVPAGGDGGFLLVRLSVASPADLTGPSQAESLMQQLRCELHTHLPLVQVSLLRVRRG
ncbi:mucin-20 isoform X2 [Marmota marmota marmota]|uniref:mucin-20 isoform X2 n=1 Tax=Marmota marmota marmota TaxID=9994 RepID=UPI0020927005|nr:mucin-20 isoform X2 [Marmota marmota marmota]